MKQGICGLLITVAYVLGFNSDLDRAHAVPPVQNKIGSQASNLFQQKKFKEIVVLLEPKIDQLPVGELLILGQSYGFTGDSLAAQKTYTSVIAQEPKNAQARTLLGIELIKFGKEKEALNVLKEALESDPKNESAYLALAEIYEKRKNKYELRLLYQDLVQKLGVKPRYIDKLCELSTLDSLYDLSKSYCPQAIRLSSKNPSNYVYLGLSFRDTGETEKANQYLKQAADSFSNSDFANMSYGQFLEEQKNFIGSYRYYRRALNANPKNSKAWTSFAASALEVQKFAESLEAFNRACRLDKSNIIQFRKATNVLRLGKRTEWLRKFESAIDKCPT